MTEVAVTGVTRVTGATPNAYPPQKAVLVGEPSQVGPYVIRVKVPSGVKLMPHKHPEDRIYTVISGVFYIGLGIGSSRRTSGPIHPAASSYYREIPGTSIGRNPAST